jgi:hypothetical protein
LLDSVAVAAIVSPLWYRCDNGKSIGGNVVGGKNKNGGEIKRVRFVFDSQSSSFDALLCNV